MIDKIFKAIGKVIVFGSWMIVMMCMSLIDVTQLDNWVLTEFTLIGYVVTSIVFFILIWLASKLAKNDASGIDGIDIDFD